jgi:hypothetical protein
MALRTRVWRPDIGDVERLSRGEAARHRGSGSRRIPHRLCLEERTLYELAKEKVNAAMFVDETALTTRQSSRGKTHSHSLTRSINVIYRVIYLYVALAIGLRERAIHSTTRGGNAVMH